MACRIAEKAWKQDHRVFVHTQSAQAAAEMDDLLWTFRQDSFVPHGRDHDGTDIHTKVLIGDGGQPTQPMDVLINLTDSVPLFFERFPRVAEIIPNDAKQKSLGRERFRYYREKGCTVESHRL